MNPNLTDRGPGCTIIDQVTKDIYMDFGDGYRTSMLPVRGGVYSNQELP